MISETPNGTIKDCYSSVRDPGSGSFAQRNITYRVESQYRMTMRSVIIKGKLIPLANSPCPTGTTLEGDLCVGAWVDQGGEFRDTLSAPPFLGYSQYTQMFWVATMPDTDNYEAFCDQIKIKAYQSPSLTNSLVESLSVINVNGNTGMKPNGTPIRRCSQ